ncbi:hypothetical protein QN277_025235 [Acacia crassicarpa]|uniref:Uncharacterized protein n=1 Tax=Acacia crassicarpa TaxID=499986 RepID=A0AAE1JDW9_9FABA|nr:hypothetical protein QN277_025235 [Acacia crassicarpa]
MVVSEEEFSRLFRVRRTVMQMLKDRGYLVTDSEINMSKNDFKLKYPENLTREDLFISRTKKNDPSDQIYVFFLEKRPENTMVGTDAIRTCILRMESEGVYTAILVVQPKLTHYALQFFAEKSSKCHLETFQESELLVNITEHVNVPEHKVLTDSEKKTLLERYTVKESQLPRIQVTDPVARYYGLECEQVVRITRLSENSGKYMTYRYVV